MSIPLRHAKNFPSPDQAIHHSHLEEEAHLRIVVGNNYENAGGVRANTRAVAYQTQGSTKLHACAWIHFITFGVHLYRYFYRILNVVGLSSACRGRGIETGPRGTRSSGESG